jgi:tripartite-type tricarboxylate transporter receptor subunit TctC
MEIGRRALAVAALLIGLGGSDHGRADEFYKGKTISLVVGATPGAAFDTNARTLAHYLPKYIPGNPSVVVRNMPGAGSMTAIRYVDGAAPKDGTVIGIFLPGIITQSIVTPEKIPIDFSNVTWLGVVSGDYSRICYGFGPSGIRSFAELLHRGPDKPFIMGTTGIAAASAACRPTG